MFEKFFFIRFVFCHSCGGNNRKPACYIRFFSVCCSTELCHIHISDIDDVTNAFLIVELPYNDAAYKQIAMHLLDDLYGKAGAIRMNGSAAAAICYVAAGRFDGWLEAFIGKWDYSAAALIVLEAGGEVTDFYGSRDFMEGHHIIATNGHLHAYLQDLVKEVRF